MFRNKKFTAILFAILAAGNIGVLLLLGLVAYGLSIYFYTYSQRLIGAARTSTYYAFAPLIGAFLSFVFLKERLNGIYLAALILMIAGTVFTVADTILHSHIHKHHHLLTHTHDGSALKVRD